jgi:hypothetical protein
MTEEKKPDDIREKQKKELLRAFQIVSSTAEGQQVLQFLCRETGFKAASLVANPMTNDFSTLSVLYHEGRRSVWLALRKLIPVKKLNIIESEDVNAVSK